MGSLKFLTTPLSATIQDLGRKNMAYYAIPTSGAMDKVSLQRANELLGNPSDAPCIEFSFTPGKIEFESDAIICLTGADMKFKINENSIKLDSLIYIKSGDILSGSWPKAKARSYLAIKGKLDLPLIYSSYSYYPNANIGLHGGANLKKGDRISWQEDSQQIEPQSLLRNEIKFCESIKIKKAPEYDLFSKDITDQLFSKEYSIDSNSNRMGARLNEAIRGENLPELDESVPVLPGFIQLTPSGKLIVILQDGHTTGGYPRIAYIPENELSVFNQIAPRQKFKFKME